MRLRTLTGLTITAIALAAPAGAQAGTCPGATIIPTSATVAAAVDATLCLANQERAAAGAPPLTLDARLTDMAAAYGRRMVAEQFFSHVSPDGGSLAERLAAIGDDPDAAGENLYWGEAVLATPAATIDGWMHSQEHRENLLDPEFRRVGLGIVAGAPKSVAGPAATVVAEFDSGADDATAHTSTVSPRPAVRRVPRARTPKAVVKAWIEAARLGDGRAFCRLQDNEMLGALYHKTGAAGIRTCVATFRAVAGLPAASELTFIRVKTTATRSAMRVAMRGQQVKFVARKFDGHWKLDSLSQ